MSTKEVQVSNLKVTWYARLSDAPLVSTGAQQPFRPYKIELVDYGPKAKVVLTPFKTSPSHRAFPVNFNLHGYDQYPECPDWVLELVGQMGWTLGSNLEFRRQA